MPQSVQSDDRRNPSRVTHVHPSRQVPAAFVAALALAGPLAWLTQLSKICEGLSTAQEQQALAYEAELSARLGLPSVSSATDGGLLAAVLGGGARSTA